MRMIRNADWTSRRVLVWLVVMMAMLSVTAGEVRAGNWPQFRGANTDGAGTAEVPARWSAEQNVRWKQALEGEGWSCPVVWGDQVILTAAVRDDGSANSPEPYEGGGGRQRSDLTQVTFRWEVMSLDARSGEVQWRKTARTGKPPLPRHSSNTYATETPATDGQRIYAYFGMTGLYCFDMRGELQWQKDLGSYEMRAGWGTSSSPVLFEGKLFLQVDNEEQSFLVAVNAETGDEVWRVNRPEPSQYSSPVIWRNSQRNELIAGGQVCRSYDPETGRLLWQLDMSKGRSSATPLPAGDRLYVGTELRNRGGSDDGGGFLFAVVPGGTGDITPPEGSTSSDFIQWKVARSGLQMASPVFCQGYLYLLERRGGIVHCIDANTGETAYRNRISGARSFWSSPWTDGRFVFCLDESGTTLVLAPGPEYRLVGRNVIDEYTWSSPALADGTVFLRTTRHLYCIAGTE